MLEEKDSSGRMKVYKAISATLLISPSLQHSKQPTTAVIVSHLYIYSQ